MKSLYACHECKRENCIHRGAFRRVPRTKGGLSLCPNLSGIKVKGHIGKWYVINEKTYEDEDRNLYLLEHETYGDNAACIIVDVDLNVVTEEVWNGFDDYEEQKANEQWELLSKEMDELCEEAEI